MSKLKIAVAGASGRMGRKLIETIIINRVEDMLLVGALDASNSPNINEDAAKFLGRKIGIPIESSLQKGLINAEYLIDFTRPEATLKHLEYCVAHGIKMIIGTTGFKKSGKAAIVAASKKTAIVFSPNMSIGVNIMIKLLELATIHLSRDYDIEIIEAHHRQKIDAPSGTALKMGEVIAKTLNKKLEDIAIYSRIHSTCERDPASIGFTAIRGGDIVGNHTVLYAGIGESIKITHQSISRKPYVNGSLRAVHFLLDKKIGLYSMQNVLGL